MKFQWNPDLYDNNHDFVHKFGGKLVTLLNPENHETILDLGCGTGDLTQKISTSCKEVIGLDNSLEMIKAAESKYKEISFFHTDAKDFRLNRLFDAVFSSSVLHWITAPEIVIKNINNHLKTRGRFVAEFGGKGCNNNVISTLTDILDSEKIIYPPIEDSLYYPSISQYTELLEQNGFEVRLAMLFDRPTELKGGLGGLKNFIEMFFIWLFDNVSSQDRLKYVELLEKRLKNQLLHNSTWIADYRRIRILAVKVKDS